VDIPGDYTVAEVTQPEDWFLTDIECLGAKYEPNLDNGAVMISITDPTRPVTCTFTNEYLPPPVECTENSIEFGGARLSNRDGFDQITVGELVAAGKYRISLFSSDPLHEAGRQTDQTQEQWKLQFLDGDGVVVYETPLTTDIPDADTMVVDANIADGVEIPDGVVAVRAQHARLGSSVNSVIPDCAVLTLIGKPPPPPPPPPVVDCSTATVQFGSPTLMNRPDLLSKTINMAIAGHLPRWGLHR
jgi:hypothetical protein